MVLQGRNDYPPLSELPLHQSMYAQGLQEEVKKMMEKGAVEVVKDPSPGLYSSVILVPKVTGNWKPLIDLSTLDLFIRKTRFKMETPHTVLAAVRKNDFMLTIDLKDASRFQSTNHPRSFFTSVWKI